METKHVIIVLVYKEWNAVDRSTDLLKFKFKNFKLQIIIDKFIFIIWKLSHWWL